MASAGYQYLITKRARQDLEALPEVIRKRIADKLRYFVDSGNPMRFAEKLTKYQDGDYRFRVGDYRIIFIKTDKKFYILRVQHRREVYKR